MKITKAGYQVIPEGDSITKKIERIFQTSLSIDFSPSFYAVCPQKYSKRNGKMQVATPAHRPHRKKTCTFLRNRL